MKSLRIIVPVIVTILVTAGAVVLATWLVGLVPEGEWAGLIKAGVVLLVVLGVLVVIAWSAYFSYIVKKSLQA